MEYQLNQKSKWTETGQNCYESGANCENCTIFLGLVGLHKNGRGAKECFQPKINEALLLAGIPLPKDRKNAIRKVQRPKATPQIINATMEEIPKIVSRLGRDIILIDIMNDLNSHEGGFFGHLWIRDTLHFQLKKLVLKGTLSSNKIDGTYYYSLVK